MAILVFLTGAVVTLVGLFLFLDPEKFRPVITWAMTESRLKRLAAARLLLAIGFYIGAPATRMPLVTIALAAVFLLSAVGMLIVGPRKINALANWWLDRLHIFALPWCAIAFAFGLFLMWLAWPAGGFS